MNVDLGSLIGPAVIAAAVSGIVAGIGFWVNRQTSITLHREKLDADIALAKRKFDYDRHQAVFKRRFELAEQTLADAYRFRSMMKFVRNGASFGSEGQTRPADSDESEAVKRSRDSYFVPLERLHSEEEFLSAMFARRTTCRAHFGPDAEKAFSSFQTAMHRVRAASSMLVEWTKDHEVADRDTMKKLRDDIWEPMAEVNGKNEIGAMIEDGVTGLEELCKPVLSWVDHP